MKEVEKRKYPSVLKSEKGFSIPEVLIVFLIAAILCIIALPQLSASLKLNRINTLNAVIATKLAEARIQAIKRNSQVSLKINSQNRKIWIESGGTQIGGSENYTSENIIQCSPSTNLTQETITFNSFGNLQTSPTTIKIINTTLNRSKTVQVSLSGKVTVGGMTSAQ